jgi:hypothetical protein
MMELLFNRREAEVKITNGAILAAIKNHESGEAVLRLLLPRRGAEIKITSWMLYTAAENKQTREAIMNLLIDHRGPGDIKITGWIADKLARRYPCGDTVWRRLLGPQGAGQLTKEALDVLVQFSSGKVMESALDNPQWGIKITDEMLRTAASNEDHGDDMIRALLRRKDNAAITMTLVQEASKNETTGDAVMEVLLQQKHVQLNLARNEIFAMVRWFNDQVISLLTEHEGVELGIDGQLIESAVNGRHGNAVMKVLLRRTGLACNFSPADFIRILSAFDEEVVRSVLKILGPDVKVTEEVMVAVAQNQIYGLEVMKLLLNYGGDDVVATQNVIQKIAWTRWGNKMMKILLEHKRIPYKVAHDTVIDITKHFDAEVMSGVLEVMGPSFKITEEVVITAVLNVSYAPEVTTLLLDHDANVAFTQNVVKEAAANTQCGFPLMRIVLDQSNNDIRTAESYIHAAAEHHNVNMMYDLLQKSADVELTGNMILDIVKSFPEWVISLLFAQKGAEVPITENVLIAAAMNPTGANVMEFLLGYKEDGLTITEGVIAAAAANQECGEDVIELLFGWTQNNANRIDPTAAAALAEPRPSVH